MKATTYVLISELRNYDFQTDVFLLVNLGYCAPIVLLFKKVDSMFIFHCTSSFKYKTELPKSVEILADRLISEFVISLKDN